MNILCITPQIENATNFYRCGHPMRKIFPNCRISTPEKISWQDMSGLDLLFYQRPYRDGDYHFILMAKIMGIKVILDYDDLLLNVPIGNGYFQVYDKSKNHIINALNICDGVIFSTNFLKEETCRLSGIENLDKKSTVVNNGLDKFFFKNSSRKHTSVSFWRGGDTHQEDLRPYVEFFKNSTGNYFFAGHRPYYFGNKFTHTVFNGPIDTLFSIHDLKPLVSFFPLEDNSFNRAKSNISMLECMAGETKYFIAPDFPEFKLCPNRYKNRQEFCEMMTNFKDLIPCDAFIREVYEKHNLESLNEKRKDFIFEIINR